jgi:hypothetical protein
MDFTIARTIPAGSIGPSLSEYGLRISESFCNPHSAIRIGDLLDSFLEARYDLEKLSHNNEKRRSFMARRKSWNTSETSF